MESWYEKGLRFECQGSGKCCSSRDEYGYVYLTNDDIKKMATNLELSEKKFLKKHCDFEIESGFYFLKQGSDPNCIFLKKNQCSVYQARPMQCRTWPFWPETMNAKTWKKEVESFCPGVNKGKLYSKKEIDNILDEQLKAEC